MLQVPVDAPKYFVPAQAITIAVVDDAFDLHQPLWKNQLYHNRAEIEGNGVDDDANGFVDDVTGWDLADNDADVNPPKQNAEALNHGTAVSGICWQMLQKLTGNSMQSFNLLPVKVMADAGRGNYIKYGYQGIDYAVQQGAKIILCCWSGGEYGKAEERSVNNAISKGVIIIGAAGNFVSMVPMFPGAALPVLNVTAINPLYKKARLANYGAFVDLAAPSDSIFTSVPYQYEIGRFLSGTSAAAPFVAAIVAVMLASDKDLVLTDIERLLKNSALPIDAFNPLYAGNFGAGLLNITSLIAEWKYPATTNEKLQPEGFIPLNLLQTKQPFIVKPAGKYPSIKLFVKQTNAAIPKGWPDLNVVFYANGVAHDTIITGKLLNHPFYFKADSLKIFSVKPPQKNPTHDWLYYKVQTLDSSQLYCSGTQFITAPNGDIEDGSGAKNYTNRCDCKWQITVPAGKKIRISFSEMETEAKIDFVYIFNGIKTNDPILAMFSGNKLPPVITSWSNSVLIWFSSNENNHFGGWKLHYETIE